MSEFRNQLEAAQAQHLQTRYEGNLARDIGLGGPSLRFWRPLAAIAALAAAVAVVFLVESDAPITWPAKPTTPQVSGPTASTTSETIQITNLPAISFENVTDWPSVSASVPALGGVPALEWNTHENSTPTTQETSS